MSIKQKTDQSISYGKYPLSGKIFVRSTFNKQEKLEK